MPNAQLTTEQVQDEAYYRVLRQAAQSALVGKIIAQADAFAFQNGRELIRKSLQAIVQEQNDLLEKKELRECDRGRKREHFGYKNHQILSASGEIDLKRLYCGCVVCPTKIHPTDTLLGFTGRYTVGLRDRGRTD